MGLKVQRPTRRIPLYQSDDQERLADLARAMERAVMEALEGEGGPKRINDTPARDAGEAYDAFKAEALERATHVNITALSGREWREMLAAHPPREDALDDEGKVVESWPQDHEVGFNVQEMSVPLVIACVDIDQFDDEAEREEFVNDLAAPQFRRLYTAVYRVNTEEGPDPKFSASSWLDQTSAVMSRLQAAEDSASSSDSPSRIGDSSEPTG